MNLQQFQYVLAVAELRHFEQAARQCFITQSTLSTMISKLESELGISIFDRKKKPVEITSEGAVIISQLKKVHREVEHLKELTEEIKGEIKGQLSIAVIPTIAPYLLPLFLQDFAKAFPNLKINVTEQTTGEIIRNIKSRSLDIGILSTPIEDEDLNEYKLYDECFMLFDPVDKSVSNNCTVDELDMSNLYLLEEGHCMRTQIIRLCEMHRKEANSQLNFEYRAGSIDSLMRFVKANNASTLLPYLACIDLSAEEKKHLREFEEPKPFRSVGIVVHRHYAKKKMLDTLLKAIDLSVHDILPRTEISGNAIKPL